MQYNQFTLLYGIRGLGLLQPLHRLPHVQPPPREAHPSLPGRLPCSRCLLPFLPPGRGRDPAIPRNRARSAPRPRSRQRPATVEPQPPFLAPDDPTASFAPTKIWRKWHRRVHVNLRRVAVASALATTDRARAAPCRARAAAGRPRAPATPLLLPSPPGGHRRVAHPAGPVLAAAHASGPGRRLPRRREEPARPHARDRPRPRRPWRVVSAPPCGAAPGSRRPRSASGPRNTAPDPAALGLCPSATTAFPPIWRARGSAAGPDPPGVLLPPSLTAGLSAVRGLRPPRRRVFSTGPPPALPARPPVVQRRPGSPACAPSSGAAAAGSPFPSSAQGAGADFSAGGLLLPVAASPALLSPVSASLPMQPLVIALATSYLLALTPQQRLPFELLPSLVPSTPFARSGAGPCLAGTAPSPSPSSPSLDPSLPRPSRPDPRCCVLLGSIRRPFGWIASPRPDPSLPWPSRPDPTFPFFSAAGADTVTSAAACAAVGLPGGAP
jgi:hypothetical protein